jgi:phage tail tape-measure protein
MNKPLIAIALVGTLSLSGCSLATAAADAAACRAMEGAIEATVTAYEQGLVDSGVLAHIDSLVGEQLRGALSSGLANDLGDFLDAVGSSDTGQSAKDKVKDLSAAISNRCSDVGVNFTN